MESVTVRMAPYADESVHFDLEVFRPGRNGSEYRLTDSEGNVIVEGDGYFCSTSYDWDSDESLRDLVGFLTTKYDRDEPYTEAHLAFIREHGEVVSIYAMEDGEPFMDEMADGTFAAPEVTNV